MEALKVQCEDNWTLATDQALLAYLSEFSQKLTSKTTVLVGKIDTLADEVDEADLRLRNTFNEFLNLANSQFIENRVYDDEDSDEEVEMEPVLDTKGHADVSVLLKEAFFSGRQALDSYFDDETQDVDDIYNTRPLPFVIGTMSFIDSEDAGLSGGGGGHG